MTLESYFPILLFAGLVTIFGVLSLVFSRLLGPDNPNPAKLAPYECGITPAEGSVAERLPVRFYVIAMLFIIFDVETVFLYPWAVVFRRLGIAGAIEMAVFVALLFGAYVYVWRRGGFDWEEIETGERAAGEVTHV